MLRIPRPALGVGAALLLLLVSPPVALAGGGWQDDRNKDEGDGVTGTVVAEDGGRDGSNGSTTGGGGGCPGAPGGACTDAAGNWWYSRYSCYLVPAPHVGPSAGREGELPYFCDTGQVVGAGPGAGAALGAIVWLPPGAAGPDPAVLAQRAVDSMRLRPLDVGLTPPAGAGTPTLVGLPVWMWVANPGPETYGPNTASATAAAVTVTATAKVSSVTWDMGDGTLVNCGQGTPYTPGHGAAASPSCGHRYERPGTYAITATSNWVVDWAGGGTSGRISLSLDSTAGITAAEAYGLVERRG